MAYDERVQVAHRCAGGTCASDVVAVCSCVSGGVGDTALVHWVGLAGYAISCGIGCVCWEHRGGGGCVRGLAVEASWAVAGGSGPACWRVVGQREWLSASGGWRAGCAMGPRPSHRASGILVVPISQAGGGFGGSWLELALAYVSLAATGSAE